MECYICHKECTGNVGEHYYSIGKGKNGKEMYRHKNCKNIIIPNERQVWVRNPVTKVKPSDKIYKRSKAKQELRKELDS